MKKIVSGTLLAVFFLTNFTLFPSASLADESFNEATLISFEEDILLNLPEINQKTLSNSTDFEIRNDIDYYLEEYKHLQSMSIQELNEYISSVVAETEEGEATLYGVQSVPTKLKIAWLAAAQIAKQAGYTAAGKLVECSVLGVDYSENNGFIGDKIKKSNVLRNILSNMKKNNKSVHRGVHEFTKSDSSDLFYALHNATFNIVKDKSLANYGIYVYDLFDFARQGVDYDNLFTSLVNDWAWLNQNTFILHPIDVNIKFSTTY